MINYSRYFEAEELVGGRFKLAALLQKRIVELMRGEMPLVDTQSSRLSEIVLEEILTKKVSLLSAQEMEEEELRMEGGESGSEATVLSAGTEK